MGDEVIRVLIREVEPEEEKMKGIRSA